MFKLLFIVFLLGFFKNGQADFSFEKITSEIVQNVNSKAAIMMIDATAKSIPNGLLKGNFYNFGSFDECLATKEEVADIRGKYCYSTLSLMELIALLPTKNSKQLETLGDIERKKQNLMKKVKPSQYDGTSFGFHLGVCVPNTLPADTLNDKIPALAFDEGLCYSERPELETKHWIALGVLASLVVIAVLSTIYDVIIRGLGKQPHSALVSFSLYNNGKQLLKSSHNEDHLLCINGLRALNMFWVILGHVFVNFLLSGAIDNWQDAFDWMDDSKNMFVFGGTLAVDSFFTIGGLLTVYIYMRTPEMDLKESAKSVPLMYLHRYLRLTPALAILVMVYATGLIKFLGDGPRWGLMQDLAVHGCEKKWWHTLLYFQNYVNPSEGMCIDPSWYLSVDMQLFVLSPLILIPLKKWPKYTLPIMVVLVGAGVAIPFYIGYSNKFTGLVLGSETTTFTNEYYFKTHARFGPYVIGMLAGYLIHKIRAGGRKFKMNVYVSFVSWLLLLGVLIFCVYDGSYLLHDTENEWADGIYVGFNRSVWSCAISIVIILCVTGNGGVMNTFLSLPLMQFLSKISYAMYLTHYLIITAVNLTRRDTVHFTSYEGFFQFFALFIITVVVSVFYTLLFESPMIILEKLIFSRSKK